MSALIPPTPTPGDTRKTLWLKVLQYLQTRPGSLEHNTPDINDSRRDTLVKILRNLLGI